MRLKRRDMKPGQVFGFTDPWWPHRRDAMVVIDASTELGFWTGERHCWGAVAPALSFEVLS